MLIGRQALRTHLGHLYVDGLLPDMCLSDKFVGAGASVDRQVMVVSGPIDKADPLVTETGVTNLGLFLKVLDSMNDDDISISVEDRFIVVTAHDRVFRLVTSAPRVIGTRIEPELKEKVLQLIPATAEWHSLEHSFVDGVLSASSILKADTMDLAVGTAGSTLGVGDPRLNVAHFDLPSIKATVMYNLLLSTSAFVPVLKQLSDFTKAQIALTGPDSVIAIREGVFLYIVSPNKPEDKKA